MSRHGPAGTRIGGWALRVLTAAGLAVDAGIHLKLAPTQPPGNPISQIDLFYVEGAISILALLLVLATGTRIAFAFAFLVAATALGAVVLYYYVDVGTLGPLPNMYEPLWSTSKTATAAAEAVALLAAAIGALTAPTHVRARHAHRSSTQRNTQRTPR